MAEVELESMICLVWHALLLSMETGRRAVDLGEQTPVPLFSLPPLPLRSHYMWSAEELPQWSVLLDLVGKEKSSSHSMA